MNEIENGIEFERRMCDNKIQGKTEKSGMKEKEWERVQCHLDKETRSISKEMRREPTPNRLLLFPVSRLRSPKIPDFC